jgi:hypothetical protein
VYRAVPFLALLLCGIALIPGAFCPFASGQTEIRKNPPDQWLPLTGDASGLSTPTSKEFDSLRAESIAGQMHIHWTTGLTNTNVVATIVASVDDPGHWLARDWRVYPFLLRPKGWETSLPVDNVDVPIIYYARVSEGGRVRRSEMRIFRPRAAGIEVPSRPFWAFLEGFEEDLESWRIPGEDRNQPPLERIPLPRNGHSSLSVKIPPGRSSIAVATTRVRGWQVEQKMATGLRLWMRTAAGAGRVRFTVYSNASTTNQVASIFPEEAPVSAQWRRMDIPFKSFSGLVRPAMDLFVVECIAEGPAEFLLDDLQLLGRWKLEVE